MSEAINDYAEDSKPTGSPNESQTGEAVTPPRSQLERVEELQLKGYSYYKMFKIMKNIVFLAEAIDACEEAVSAMSHNDPSRGATLGTIGQFLHTRFEESGDLHDLERVITRCEEDLAAMSYSEHNHSTSGIQINLSRSLYIRP